MKKLLIVLAALAFTGPAYAAPPTAEQKDAFYSQCFKTSGDKALCTCKADAAMKLLDSEFMAVVLAAMRENATLDDQYADAYDEYIARSIEACGMGSAM
jgi:hypothetical protein